MKAVYARWIVSAGLSVTALPLFAQCPAGTVEIGRERAGDQIRVYCGTIDQANDLRDIDAKLQTIDETLARDRRAIEGWNRDLPGYLAAFDEWLALDSVAQRKMVERAEDLGTTLLLAKLQITSRYDVVLKEQEIESLQRTIRVTPLGSPEFEELMRARGKAAGHLSTLRTDADLWQFLDDAKSVTSGVDAAQREEYLRALMEVGGLALHDPRFKILVSETDFTVAAIYAKSADMLARRKVDQLLALGTDRLRALNALSAVYARDVRARKDLKRRRTEILEGGS